MVCPESANFFYGENGENRDRARHGWAQVNPGFPAKPQRGDGIQPGVKPRESSQTGDSSPEGATAEISSKRQGIIDLEAPQSRYNQKSDVIRVVGENCGSQVRELGLPQRQDTALQLTGMRDAAVQTAEKSETEAAEIGDLLLFFRFIEFPDHAETFQALFGRGFRRLAGPSCRD